MRFTRIHGTFSNHPDPFPSPLRLPPIVPHFQDLSASSLASRHTPLRVPSVAPLHLPLHPPRYLSTMRGITTSSLSSSCDTVLALAPRILEMTPIASISKEARISPLILGIVTRKTSGGHCWTAPVMFGIYFLRC